MNPAAWLRIASVATLLYFIGHMIGRPWRPVTGPNEMSVIDAMTTDRFTVGGVHRSYWDFYQGFGIVCGVLLLTIAVLLWQMGGLVRGNGRPYRSVVATLAIAFAVNAVLTWKYIFPLPSSFAIAITACLAIAFVLLGRQVPRSA